jgi:TRAP-type C4-dicarboxylate transport system permease small subunit
MRKLRKVIEAVLDVADAVSGVALVAAMVLIMVEVITRYVIAHPFTLADEYSGYALVILTFLSLASTMNKGGHIRITFAVQPMPGKISNWLRLVTLIVGLGWVGLAFVVSTEWVIDSFRRGMKSISTLMTPLGYPRMVIPIGLLLLFFAFVLAIGKVIRAIREGTSVEATSERIVID